ncbi:hypothetical protein RIF29_30700 [Crotalaria pallida]|uniref:Bulb-type lectin domain-containing protein n=1 Tax=Crotalaria pallida TaxID=3830 RepID=A0AAN9EGW1_CROPI
MVPLGEGAWEFTQDGWIWCGDICLEVTDPRFTLSGTADLGNMMSKLVLRDQEDESPPSDQENVVNIVLPNVDGIYADAEEYPELEGQNQPIKSDNSSGSLLSFDHSSVLKIESQQGEKPIILYSPPTPHSAANTTMAAVLDTGNFVVQQLNPNGSTKSVLWQSFDYPTNILLPGMKLDIVNHKTGHNLSLVSWLSYTDPAPGPFSLKWEPKEGELITRRQGQVIWKSGKLRDNRFEHIS